MVAIVTEITRRLEELPYERLLPSEHQCDDQFAMCTVSVIHSYESSNIIALSEENAFAQTAARETSVVVETERQATRISPSVVRPNRGTDVLDPTAKSKPHQNGLSSDSKPFPNSSPL